MIQVESAIYEDTGCEFSAKCVLCPRPKCKYDEPNLARQEKRTKKDLTVIKSLQKMTIPQTARHHKITIRTVWRIKSRVKEEALIN